MPSDLTKPGALAFESIPVKANDPQAYAAPSVKRELARIYKRDGCHHCGKYVQQSVYWPTSLYFCRMLSHSGLAVFEEACTAVTTSATTVAVAAAQAPASLQ
jgi:hypothetical protein